MTTPLSIGQEITWQHEGRKRRGVVEVTWQCGRFGLARVDADDLIPIRADQLGRPAHTIEIGMDLDDTRALALSVLAGQTVPGSVTAQMIKLAAAVVTLTERKAA